MIKVVVFDLDDTLISEKEYIKSGYMHIAKKLVNIVNDEKINIYNNLIKLLNEDVKYVFNRLYHLYEIEYSDEDIKSLVDYYRSHKPNIEFYDDVDTLLDTLKSKDIKIGIITDGYAVSQKQKLSAVGAYDIFDKIIVTDDLGREFWKPHSKSFEMMKEHFNVQWEEMVYIGDNPSKDFFIGSLYPIKTVQIMRNKGFYSHADYYRGVKSSVIIKNLSEVNF